MSGTPPRSIALFRALQLGDLLSAVPAFRALRRAEPDAHITLIGLPWAEEFVTRFSAYLDDFVAFPGWPGIAELGFDEQRFDAFEAEAAARRFDLAVQMHGDGSSSNAFIDAVPAAAHAGFRPDEAPSREGFVPYPEELPEVGRLLSLAAALGGTDLDPTLEFPLFEEERREAAGLLASVGYDGTAPLTCLHAGGRGADRRWDARNFAAIADELVARGYAVALTGSDVDRAVNEEVITSAGSAILDLTGRTTIGTLGAVIARSSLVVTNDSGPSHLAAALRVPSVVIFTGSDPARWAPTDRELHRVVGAGRPGGGPPAPPPPLDEALAALPEGPSAPLGCR